VKRYDRVRQFLEESVGGDDIGAHGNFWRDLSLEDFKAHKVFGRVLLVPSDADNSNLVKAIEGRTPFGKDTGTPGATFRRMPAGRPPMPPEHILYIREWIADGCPDEEERPADSPPSP
jgi:hypothetical protein